MFHSTEIRWFAEGSPEPVVEDWFRQSDLLSAEVPRTDSYLLLPGCTTTGIKFREGTLEVKAQTSRPEPVQYDNGISGYKASWVKWSSDVPVAELTRSQPGEETWVQVEKTRLLRIFALASGAPKETPQGEFFDGPGCQVETARIRVILDTSDWNRASVWWSMCLEAFGDRGEVLPTLDFMASQPSLAELAGALPQDASMSFPDWLARLNY